MADETPSGELEQPEEEAPKKGKAVPLLLMVVGLAAGGAAGVLFVGPALAAPGGEEAAQMEEGAPSEGGHGEEGEGGEGEGAPAELYPLTNVIVNPAGSPSRFLLVDLALKLSTPEAAAELAAREAEARDALLQIFGRRTVDELSDIALRETLKGEAAQTLSALLESGDVVSLFMPRFVIQ